MMTRMKCVSFVLAVAVCLALKSASSFAVEPARDAAPAPADLSVFLSTLGKKVSDFKTLKTDFTQEKEMAMFKDKLVLKGRIFLEKPNKVAWHVDSPLRYSVLITDKVVRQWDEDSNQVQEISLTKNPIFQNVLNQLTVWFSGEYSSLIETNRVRIVKHEPLVIEFLPLDKNIAKKVIKSITITFRDDQKYLQQIRIQELNGDVTTIHFANTILNAPLDSRSFEVNPANEHSSRTMDGDCAQLSFRSVVCSRVGPMAFLIGVKGHV